MDTRKLLNNKYNDKGRSKNQGGDSDSEEDKYIFSSNT